MKSSVPVPVTGGERTFCTYFDSNYLTRGLALYQSLQQHCETHFELYVLCLDEVTFQILAALNFSSIKLISLKEIEQFDTALVGVKPNRTKSEYFWTLTPILPLYILDKFPQIDTLLYVDADLYFFSGLDPIYKEFQDYSIMIVEHRFPPKLENLAASVGKFNVGLVGFRKDANALECLRWWRERCMEWCYARIEDGKFGDQKYLDDWPSRFKNVVVAHHAGIGVGPWNLSGIDLEKKNHRLWITRAPMIFYHFHGIRILSDRFYIAHHEYLIKAKYKRWVYEPYLKALGEVEHLISDEIFVAAKVRVSFRSEMNRAMRGQVEMVGSTLWIGIVAPIYLAAQSAYRKIRYRATPAIHSR